VSVLRGTADNFLDLVAKLDAFLTQQGHAWGRTYSGVGDGRLVGIDGSEGGYLGGPDSVAETFVITAVNSTTFKVEGTVTGALADATVGTPYVTDQVQFLIEASATPFEAGDTFTLNTTPPWQRLIRRGVLESQFRTGVNFTNVQNAYTTSINYAEANGANPELRLEAVWPVPVAQYTITADSANYGPGAWTLDYSDDGATWTTADTRSGITWATGFLARTFDVPGAPGEHKHWRLRFTAGGTSGLRIRNLRVRASASDEFTMEAGAFIAWRAPGADGEQEINISALLYGDASLNTYNLRWYGSRFWDSTRWPADQANSSGERVQYLYNSPMPFTFVANGHRLISVVKVGTFYNAAYLGFHRSYDPPSANPWPCVVAANMDQASRNYAALDNAMHNFWTPGRGGMVVHMPNGSWAMHSNLYNTGGTVPVAEGDQYGKVYPSTLYSTGKRASYLRENIDGSYTLIPCTLLNFNPRHASGELDGAYWVSGFNNTAENVVRRDGFAHLCFPNINRTEIADFAAIRLD